MDKAKDGDVAAAKLVLSYAVGQPVAPMAAALGTLDPHVDGEEAIARLTRLLIPELAGKEDEGQPQDAP